MLQSLYSIWWQSYNVSINMGIWAFILREIDFSVKYLLLSPSSFIRSPCWLLRVTRVTSKRLMNNQYRQQSQHLCLHSWSEAPLDRAIILYPLRIRHSFKMQSDHVFVPCDRYWFLHAWTMLSIMLYINLLAFTLQGAHGHISKCTGMKIMSVSCSSGEHCFLEL